ncbi:MAG TPA: hypothetical protein VF571_20760 [Pyrinomonadaceae bacterium]
MAYKETKKQETKNEKTKDENPKHKPKTQKTRRKKMKKQIDFRRVRKKTNENYFQAHTPGVLGETP